MIKVLLSTALLFVCTHSWALRADADQPVHIQADSVQYNNQTGSATYTGHVRVKQGSTRLQAHQLRLFRNPQHDVDKIIATGAPAHYSTLPDGQSVHFHASANTIEYHLVRGKIFLIENGIAILGNNHFSGPRIRYDISQQLLETDASHDGQITIVLEPHHHRPNCASSAPNNPSDHT